MRYTRRGAIGVALGLAAVGCTSGVTSSPARGDDDPMRITYGDHPSQFAELSLPDATTPAPVVVVLHGGYWSASYGLELGRPLAEDLVGRGFAVLNVEYRRVGDGGGWPQTGDDVAAAVTALADRADARLDLNRVVALGHSAGGQLAGWLAAQPGVVSGIVLQAGVLDLVEAYDDSLGGGAVPNYLGATPAEDMAVYSAASPIALLPLGIPSIAIHGTADTVVPIDQSQRFVEAASRAGDLSELRTFDGDHFAPITIGTPAWELCVAAVHQLTGS